MVKKICFTVALSCCIASYAYAGDCQVKGHREGNEFHGNTTCTDTTISDIKVDGSLFAKKFNVKNSFTVTGMANGNEMDIKGPALIQGEALLEDVTTNMDATIDGLLDASDSHFLAKITLRANKARLNNSTATDIYIEKIIGARQYLCLNNNSKISGTVTFGSGDGVVYLEGGSTVGHVVGGKSIEASCPTKG